MCLGFAAARRVDRPTEATKPANHGALCGRTSSSQPDRRQIRESGRRRSEQGRERVRRRRLREGAGRRRPRPFKTDSGGARPPEGAVHARIAELGRERDGCGRGIENQQVLTRTSGRVENGSRRGADRERAGRSGPQPTGLARPRAAGVHDVTGVSDTRPHRAPRESGPPGARPRRRAQTVASTTKPSGLAWACARGAVRTEPSAGELACRQQVSRGLAFCLQWRLRQARRSPSPGGDVARDRCGARGGEDRMPRSPAMSDGSRAVRRHARSAVLRQGGKGQQLQLAAVHRGWDDVRRWPWRPGR